MIGQRLCEAIGRERVARVVDDFYARIRRHSTLVEPFPRLLTGTSTRPA